MSDSQIRTVEGVAQKSSNEIDREEGRYKPFNRY